MDRQTFEPMAGPQGPAWEIQTHPEGGGAAHLNKLQFKSVTSAALLGWC